ncbi:MAG: hypothetical protein KAH32_04500, partial [Chlamydiia bacterium]|nr:hypothetical protein [Chlamydiia bacterium]
MEDNNFKLDEHYEKKNIDSLADLDLQLSVLGESNSFGEGGELSAAEQFQASNKKPDPAMEGLKGAASGAAAGAAFGPWGAAIGGVVGGAAGVMKGVAGGKEYDRNLSVANVSDNNADRLNEVDSGLGSVVGGTQVGFANSYS